MKVKLLMVGKTQENYIDEGCGIFNKRIIHYLPFEQKFISGQKKIKNLSVFVSVLLRQQFQSWHILGMSQQFLQPFYFFCAKESFQLVASLNK